ncbi:TolB family protein [Parasphaerochaeta coccoides]|uniref:WD40-like beta Propeller containing protein n=1 Tax=Parasphaerochaeta coccoides (strain ATCC BAA-1237 / DSM 17374 / SPN1) TaxID=760011 RepID=F4GJX9_PARC1|nr:PD40 domain-containing protein [Parasphaerochaeta coccoides]AEC01404.1 hypothetical protein Spico_0166 [Parasphaerochaeta coccoides DSM 17374]
MKSFLTSVFACGRVLFLLSLAFLALTPLYASGQEPYRGWEQSETEHFLIIFEPKDSHHAYELASFADETYTKISRALNHAPSGKIPVILAGRTAFANGSFAPMPNRITLYLTSPDDRFLGTRTENWLKTVFTHELTHYLHLTSPIGIGKYLAIFGPGMIAFNQVLMPLWWIEGLTVYAESVYSEGGRGDSPLFALQWEAPLLEEKMWSLAQGSYSSHMPPSGRYYLTGYLMVDYLVHHYGEETIIAINNQFTGFPFLGMDSAFRSHTGMTALEIFSAALKEQADKLASRSRFRTGTLFSPDEPGTYSLPYRTEAGLIGLTAHPDRTARMVRYGANETETSMLAVIPGADGLSFSASDDGLKVAYSRIHSTSWEYGAIGTAAVSYADIVLYNVDDDSSVWLTSGGRFLHPALSPDGKKLIAIEATGTRYRLVRIPMDGGDGEVLYDNPETSVYEPRFSPDGRSIAFIETSHGLSSLRIMDEDGIRSVVPPGRAEIRYPRFSGSDTLLFSSDVDGTFALYGADISSSKNTDGESSILLLARDPSGVLGAIRDGERYIYATATAEGQALRSIPATEVLNEPVIWKTEEHRPSGQEQSEEASKEFPTSRYHDIPRFSYWFPVLGLEFGDSTGGVYGVSASFDSLLQKNSVNLSATWQTAEQIISIYALYRHSPGPFVLEQQTAIGFSLNGGSGAGSVLESQTAVTVPLARKIGFRGTGLLHLAGMAYLGFDLSEGFALSQEKITLQYDWNESAPVTALFGRDGFLMGMSVSASQDKSAGNAWSPAFAFLSVQKAVAGRANHVVRLDADLGVSLTDHRISSILLPSNSPVSSASPWETHTDFRAKLRAGLSYSIPWAIDQPLPCYGGITGIGLTLKAESMAYLLDSGMAWEEDVYLSAELGITLKIGSLSAITPKIGVIYSPARNSVRGYVSMLGTTMGIGASSHRLIGVL